MTTCTIYWIRRDLRLADNPALCAALADGGPVLPVFIRDPLTDALGAAPAWRLEQGLAAFDAALRAVGSRLILRHGDPATVLADLAAQTGARAVHWTRAYDPEAIARDTKLKAQLTEGGLTAQSHAGHVLFEPWTVKTGQGGYYKVYTPFWKSVRGTDPGTPLPAPARIPAPGAWPASDDLADWGLGRAMQRGAPIVARHAQIGEAAAADRLARFVEGPLADYDNDRDRLDRDGTSGLSENLALGEISARRCWAAGRAALERGNPGAETFLKEIVWRDFAYHLMFHTPHILTENWRPEWDSFPWRQADERTLRWQQGRTGEPVIDAAMREMYVTGRMHNRARMLVASYLTKHLMTDWRVGQAWFAECLIDWDPASNAMGWQWAAGSGPDASPFFRIFNPATQADKFDPARRYREGWVAELSTRPVAADPDRALAFFDAVPRAWGLDPQNAYPAPMVDLKEGRARALEAYQTHRSKAAA